MPKKKYNLKKVGSIAPPYGITGVEGPTFSFYPYKHREGRTLVTKYPKGTIDNYGNQIDSTKNKTYYYLGREDREGIPSLDSVKAGNLFKPDTLFYSDGAKITNTTPDVFLDKNNNPVIIKVGGTGTIGKKKINEINEYLKENSPVYPVGYLNSWITGYGYPYEGMTPSNPAIETTKIKRYGIPKHELDENFIGPVISREFKLGGSVRKKADGGTFWQQTGMTPWDLAGAGVQFTGNLASSLINQGAINRLKFTPIHTMTVAEAPVKFNTNYNINPQLGNLRESLGSIEREVTNNSASSRNRIGRITGSRFRGIGAYNELYGHKLNQETNMMNAEAQNRQGVYARNAARLQQNIARDTAYNTQGQDNLDNTKTSLTGQNWTNFTQNTADSLVQAYNRGQHRLSDATSLAYLLARDIDAAKIFTGKENPTFDDIWNHAYTSFGIPGRRQTKLRGRSSLIR